ncbi:MAG: phenylalanine 4-monooxygenase [Myxococcota bacterium]
MLQMSVEYTDVEQDTWRRLYQVQVAQLEARAWSPFMNGVDRLGISSEELPQVEGLTWALHGTSRFRVKAVPGMIDAPTFFGLLARRTFPVATFIRTPEQWGYVEAPDVFHEVFGHCPLLTRPDYADIVQRFGLLAMRGGPVLFEPLQRLFWFTIEFGLIESDEGLRLFGAGLLSSPEEAVLALESTEVERRPFDLDEILASDYRVDAPQPRYFALKCLHQLSAALDVIENQCALNLTGSVCRR